MPQRVLSYCTVLCLVLGLLLVPPTIAQSPTTISIRGPADQIDKLLRRGRQLESERRWGEAISHYEGAVRRFPDDGKLQRRFELTRLHYDLSRRYADRSFCNAVATLPTGRALDLYAGVLLKIDAHYVETPNWKTLVEHGTNNLEVALGERVFLDKNLPEDRLALIDDFRRELHRVLGPRVIATRQDARDAVETASTMAQRRLGIYPTAVVLEYLCGATNSLDVYSGYLTPDQLDEVYAQIEGNFVGLGIELKAENNELLIVRVIPCSPAQQAGMLSGDRILSVDGQSTRDLSTDQAANLLHGKAGTIVRLVIARPAQESRELTIQRRRVEVPSIDQAKIIDRDYGIGYFRLVCFQKTTCRDLEEALWKLHREGMRGLIIDLRGNPGGLLITSVEAADRFVERGVIVSTRGRSSQEDFTYSAHASGTWRVPLVVLIDQESASAAEIFSGAIRDHRRGTIVGEQSYGKGSVQGIFPLDMTRAGVRLTTARFYSPNGRPYSRSGVAPHVPVQLAAKPLDGHLARRAKDSAMLDAAVQTARQLVQQQHAQNKRQHTLLKK